MNPESKEILKEKIEMYARSVAENRLKMSGFTNGKRAGMEYALNLIEAEDEKNEVLE